MKKSSVLTRLINLFSKDKKTTRKSKRSNRKNKKHVYKGKDAYKNAAFNLTREWADDYFERTGKHPTEEIMENEFKHNLKKVKREHNGGQIKISRPKNKVILNTHRNNRVSIYSKYKNKYPRIDNKTNALCEVAESLINNDIPLIDIIQRIFPSSKIVAFIKISSDCKQLFISIIEIKGSTDRLIDLVETTDNKLLPTKKEFNEIVNIIKNTKSIYNSIKDIAKQMNIIII